MSAVVLPQQPAPPRAWRGSSIGVLFGVQALGGALGPLLGE